MIQLLERFSAGIAARDTEAVMQLLSSDEDLVIVTSEEELLRGPHEFRAFLQRYSEGSTTYSWEWHHHDAAMAGPVGWLVAEGAEYAKSEASEERHPYRMTIVAERRDGEWILQHAHGSSPQVS